MRCALGLLREVVLLALDTLRSQQAALRSDRARRGHRHHRDRRHDVAHPRLRPVAARQHPRAGAEHDFRRQVQRHQHRERPRIRGTGAPAQPDGRRREGDREARAVGGARRHLARRRRPRSHERVFYRGERTKTAGRARRHGELRRRELRQARAAAASSPRPRSTRGGAWSCWATRHTRRCSPRAASIRSARRCASAAVEYTVIGVLGKRPSAGNFNPGQDDFVVIPQTTHQIMFTRNQQQGFAGGNRGSAMIAVVPREDAPPGQALAEVEEIMRIRHSLKLDEENDFDIAHAGRRRCGVGSGQPRDVPGAGGDLVDRADGRAASA